MKAIRHFEEFVKERIVKKQIPDKSRADFLINEAKISPPMILSFLPLSHTKKHLELILCLPTDRFI